MIILCYPSVKNKQGTNILNASAEIPLSEDREEMKRLESLLTLMVLLLCSFLISSQKLSPLTKTTRNSSVSNWAFCLSDL